MSAQYHESNVKIPHTPGPWRPNGDNPEVRPEYREDRYITTADFDEESGAGEIICVCRGHGPKMKANARLIAAAPKMIEALRNASRMLHHLGMIHGHHGLVLEKPEIVAIHQQLEELSREVDGIL